MTKKNKRLCIIGPTYPYRGGISHHTTLLCKTLREEHEVLFISFSRQYPKLLFPGKTDRDPSQTGLEVDKVEYLIDSVNPLSWYKTARRIAHFKPERLIIPWWVIFWVPQFATIVTLVKKWCGSKITFLCHNVIEHEASAVKVALSRFMLSKADRIVTQSSQETVKVQKLLGQKAPVKTGFHPTYAPLGGKLYDRSLARKTLNLNGKILLFFGFVRPYKGLDVLLEAMPLVIAQHNATLLVVGEFWKDKEAYLRQISDLNIGDNIKIIDDYVPNEDIGLYFAVADLVVQPYHSATGSGICQLAYGLKKPVIATRVGNLDEVIDDRVNGRLVPASNPETLAKALNESLQDDILNKLNNNAAKTSDRFSWERLGALLCE